MATTTPNFGWSVPTSSDLVKNGATAIETLGDSIDASLVDLKGGTAGQVLAKATGTDMDFTWTTPSAGGASFAVNGTINGAFDIWQRGTSFASGATQLFSADRWWISRTSSMTGLTLSRQTSNAQGTQYCARMQRDSGNTATNLMRLFYDFETSNSIIYAGQAVTVSFYARKGANYSGGDFTFDLKTGTGTDQSQWGGFTGAATPLTVTATAASMNTSTFVRYSGTVTLASTVTQIGFLASWTPTGTAGAADFVEITGVQIEKGSTATTFNRNSGSIQGETSACQRYYYRLSGATYTSLGNGVMTSATKAQSYVGFPQLMRTAPTINTTGTASNYAVANAVAYTCSSVPVLTGTIFTTPSGCTVEYTSSGMTAASGAYIYINNNADAFLAFSAEL